MYAVGCTCKADWYGCEGNQQRFRYRVVIAFNLSGNMLQLDFLGELSPAINKRIYSPNRLAAFSLVVIVLLQLTGSNPVISKERKELVCS